MRKRRGYFCFCSSQRSLEGQIYGIDTLDLFSTDGKVVKGPANVRRAVLSQTGFMSENIYSHGVPLRWYEFTPCENIGAGFFGARSPYLLQPVKKMVSATNPTFSLLDNLIVNMNSA